MRKRLSVGLVLAGALAAPTLLHAADYPWERGVALGQQAVAASVNTPTLSLAPSDESAATAPVAQKSAQATPDIAAPVLTLDAADPGLRLHGFFDLRVNSAYITPRGLVVLNSGVQVQPLAGLVFNVYSGTGPINSVSLIGGIWSDLTSYHPGGGADADIWDECDFFGSADVKFLQKFDFTYSLEAWTFPTVGSTPENNPHTEYNMEFKLAYDDSEYLKDFALHPYVDLFWNFAGQSSPVASQATTGGNNDKTFYVELGIAPSYTYKGIANYPITFTVPSYFSVGDSSFWGQNPTSGDRSNFGVFSTGLKVSVPLTFIPENFGKWSAYVGVTYIYTANPGLTYVNEHVLSNAGSENLFIGYAGVGFSF